MRLHKFRNVLCCVALKMFELFRVISLQYKWECIFDKAHLMTSQSSLRHSMVPGDRVHLCVTECIRCAPRNIEYVCEWTNKSHMEEEPKSRMEKAKQCTAKEANEKKRVYSRKNNIQCFNGTKLLRIRSINACAKANYNSYRKTHSAYIHICIYSGHCLLLWHTHTYEKLHEKKNTKKNKNEEKKWKKGNERQQKRPKPNKKKDDKTRREKMEK